MTTPRYRGLCDAALPRALRRRVTAGLGLFYSQFTEEEARRGLESHATPRFIPSRIGTVLNWLTHDWHFLGMTGQIWMPVFGAGLLVYIAILIIARRRDTRAH